MSAYLYLPAVDGPSIVCPLCGTRVPLVWLNVESVDPGVTHLTVRVTPAIAVKHKCPEDDA